jgi:hypothetical protein
VKSRVINILIITIILFACKKDMVRSTTAQLKVINASPNSGNLLLQQNLKDAGSFPYLTGLMAASTAITIDSGFNNYKLLQGGNEVSSWLFANNGLNYSLLICDSAISSSVKHLFIKDELDTTGLGKRAKIRVIQLSPDVDSVELVTIRKSNPAQDSALIIDLQYFGKFSQTAVESFGTFFPIVSDTSLMLKIRRKSNNSIARTYQLSFSKHKIYSLVLKGYDLRAGRDSLSMSVITHN